MILAGDIGGTHTRIALVEENAGRLRLALERIYASREHKSLDEIVSLFLSNEGVAVKTACFGIAGPVLHGRVSTPNLAWMIDAIQLSVFEAPQDVFDPVRSPAEVAGVPAEEILVPVREERRILRVAASPPAHDGVAHEIEIDAALLRLLDELAVGERRVAVGPWSRDLRVRPISSISQRLFIDKARAR